MGPDIDIDLAEIMRTFSNECAERICEMEQAAIALETQPHEKQFLETIFRGAHTLKGNAGSLGFTALAQFAHEMEELLQRFRGGNAVVTSNTVTLLLQSMDAVRDLVEQSIAGSDKLKPYQEELLDRLTGRYLEQDEHQDELDGPDSDKKKSRNIERPVSSDRENGRSYAVADHTGTVRVNVQKLDHMLNLAGELAIAQGRLRQVLVCGNSGKDPIDAQERLERVCLALQEEVMKLRMVSVGPLFRHFVRVVRDVAAAAGKEARLVVEGEDVEIDLSMTEQLRDSLTHMIRNAIDHGIEMPEARRAQGKDHCGLLLLTAFHDSGSIVIQLKDDGAGLNRERIIAQIKKQGFIADVDKMSDGEIYQFVFASGFSTAPAVTDLSGRGIGLDIVRRNIEVLRGTVQLDSEVGMGTTVTIRLPLTLAMIEGFSVDVDGDTYILPLNTVLECLALPAQERGQGLSGVISLRGEPLPYIRLRDRFEIGGSPATQESIVVVAGHGIKVGIVVDGLYGPRQTVIKPLNKHLQHAPGISGSAVLGNGRVAFIVDVASLLADVIRHTKADNGSVAKCLGG